MILKLLIAIMIELFVKQFFEEKHDEVEVVNEVMKGLNLLNDDEVVLF